MKYEINPKNKAEFKPVEVCITCETKEDLRVLCEKLSQTAKNLTYDWQLWSKLSTNLLDLLE